MSVAKQSITKKNAVVIILMMNTLSHGSAGNHIIKSENTTHKQYTCYV